LSDSARNLRNRGFRNEGSTHAGTTSFRVKGNNRSSTGRGRLEREWAEAEALDRAEAAHAFRQRTRLGVLLVASVAAVGALLSAIFPLTPGFSAGDSLAALASAGAAAIHLAVAKPHFDEYTLFGVFFVGSGLAQLAWPIWLLFRRRQPLLVLGGSETR
jgi:hypothetical protein